MNKRNFEHFGERLREERLRIAMQQLDLADACGVSRGTLATWEKGEQATNAASLAVMAGLGIDVLYVVTGARQGETEATLAPEEKALLTAWRSSGEKGRTALAAVAEVLKTE